MIEFYYCLFGDSVIKLLDDLIDVFLTIKSETTAATTTTLKNI